MDLSDDESVIDLNISIVSTSVGQSCIKKILNALKTIDNKHKWNNENVDSFLQKYLHTNCTKKSISKLFLYEMDIFNNKVHETFGCYLFNTKDNKSVRVKKIYSQLKQMPQLLNYESSSEENDDVFQPKSLKEIYMQFVLSSKYPKEYLAAPVCEITHMEIVSNWEVKSPITITLNLPIADCIHIIFNYPKRSSRTNQCEMHTFNYTHILNNLRFHVSNDAIHGISANAFMSVSEVNHDVLPHAIVEDKLDRQNCSILQKFFSKEVQKILQDLGHEVEAEFTEHTRN